MSPSSASQTGSVFYTPTMNGSAEGEITNAFVSKFPYISWLVVEHTELDLQHSNKETPNVPITQTSVIAEPRTVTPHDRTLWLF